MLYNMITLCHMLSKYLGCNSQATDTLIDPLPFSLWRLCASGLCLLWIWQRGRISSLMLGTQLTRDFMKTKPNKRGSFHRHLADCIPHYCFYVFVRVQSTHSSCSHVTFLLGREPLSFSNVYLGFTTGPGTETAASKVVCGIDEWPVILEAFHETINLT